MKRKISILLLIALGFVPIIPNFRASSTQARTIDRHGKQIPSIFSGVSPSARIALEYARRINERREILGSFRTTIYRRADRGQLKRCVEAPLLAGVITRCSTRDLVAHRVEGVKKIGVMLTRLMLLTATDISLI